MNYDDNAICLLSHEFGNEFDQCRKGRAAVAKNVSSQRGVSRELFEYISCRRWAKKLYLIHASVARLIPKTNTPRYIGRCQLLLTQPNLWNTPFMWERACISEGWFGYAPLFRRLSTTTTCARARWSPRRSTSSARPAPTASPPPTTRRRRSPPRVAAPGRGTTSAGKTTRTKCKFQKCEYHFQLFDVKNCCLCE